MLFEIIGGDYTTFSLSGGARGKILGSFTVEVLSGSGTWTKPDDVDMVLVTVCGGGGGGAFSIARPAGDGVIILIY